MIRATEAPNRRTELSELRNANATVASYSEHHRTSGESGVRSPARNAGLRSLAQCAQASSHHGPCPGFDYGSIQPIVPPWQKHHAASRRPGVG